MALIPIFAEVAASNEIRYGQVATRSTLRQLYPKRAASSLSALAQGAADWRDRFCLDATGAKCGACESLSNQWTTSRRHLETGRTGPARNTLAAIAREATRADDADLLTLWEHRLLTGNVGYILSQLR